MKRINYGQVSYLVGDSVADLLVRYTALLAASADADVVDVKVLGPDGNPEVASFALGPGILMTAETTRSELEEPENADIITYMHGRIEEFLEGKQRSISREMVESFGADVRGLSPPTGPV